MVLCAARTWETQARAPGVALGPAGPPEEHGRARRGLCRESGPKAVGASLGPERGVVPGDSTRDPGGSEQGLAVCALPAAHSAGSPSLGTVALEWRLWDWPLAAAEDRC